MTAIAEWIAGLIIGCALGLLITRALDVVIEWAQRRGRRP